jgi:Family of unknown function (DUF6502)
MRVIKHTKDKTQGDGRIADALATELLGVCMATLKQYGVHSSRLLALSRRTVVSAGAIPTASKMFQDVDQLSELANEWTENPAYVDSSGHPRILSIAGSAPSFAALVSKFFAGRRPNEILEMGCRTQILERIGKDKVGQFGGCVIFTGNPVLMLVHAIQSVRWFLSTTLANASRNAVGRALPDRKACSLVCEEDLAEFTKAMRQPIINLVEMGNRWLSARSPRGSERPGQRAVRMGVHAYIFRDPAGKTLGRRSDIK